jgi:L-asparaginase
MLRANRCGSGPVHSYSNDERLGLLPAGSLNPQKARVLLLLCLIAGVDRGGLSAQLLKFEAVN